MILYDADGNEIPLGSNGFKINPTYREIKNFFEKKIRGGVQKFFSALYSCVNQTELKSASKINIFLAGNSCKSPIVKKVFQKEIEKEKQKISDFAKENGQGGNFDIEVFPPLGTDAADEKLASMGIEVKKDDFERPTGKTGVAFGLVLCRKGGRIRVIDNITETPFEFYLGWEQNNHFILIDNNVQGAIKGKPSYDSWLNFGDAGGSFELLYTTLPDCTSGELEIHRNPEIHSISREVEHEDEDKNIYIKAKSPHELEWAVASSDADAKAEKFSERHTLELK